MRAKTFLEIHHALLNGEPLDYGKGKAEKLFNGLCGFWIGDSESYCSNGEGGDTYNDLRQNIILLCAAINGEL